MIQIWQKNAKMPRLANRLRLERFQAKWIPVRVKKTRQIRNLELRSDSIGTEKALGKAIDGRRAAHGRF
jgi:hypothetical protein